MIATSVLTISLCGQLVLSATVCSRNINIGFNVNQVANLASRKGKSKWEWGTQSQALIELFDPFVSVFSDTASPDGAIPNQTTAGTTYAKRQEVCRLRCNKDSALTRNSECRRSSVTWCCRNYARPVRLIRLCSRSHPSSERITQQGTSLLERSHQPPIRLYYSMV
jgi:hypothetical protein